MRPGHRGQVRHVESHAHPQHAAQHGHVHSPLDDFEDIDALPAHAPHAPRTAPAVEAIAAAESEAGARPDTRRWRRIAAVVLAIAACAGGLTSIGALHAQRARSDAAHVATPASSTQSSSAAATAAPDPTLNDVTTTALANLTALQQQGGDGLITKDLTLSSEQRAAIDAAVADITAAGYQVSFTAVDMATGGALSEGGDVMRYSASSIKAPYIVALAQTGTIDLDKVAAGQAGDLTDLVTNTLTVSDNDSYATLVHRYGTDPFVKWKDGVGMADGQVGDYGDLDTLDLARMWTMTYDFLFADSPARGGTASASARAWLAKQMVGSLNSSIDESNYGNDLTVYSKASWINGDGGYYALNDGGIVVPSGASDLSDKPQGAVIAILSNACGRNDLLQPLAAALRDAVGTVPTTTADTTDGTAATTGGPTDGTAATTEGTTTEATDGADDGQGAALAWSER